MPSRKKSPTTKSDATAPHLTFNGRCEAPVVVFERRIVLPHEQDDSDPWRPAKDLNVLMNSDAERPNCPSHEGSACWLSHERRVGVRFVGVFGSGAAAKAWRAHAAETEAGEVVAA